MQNYFYQLADYLQTLLQGDEIYLAYYSGENSDFVRINRCCLRQAGSVLQHHLSITLISGQKQIRHNLTLSASVDDDQELLRHVVSELRSRLEQVPEDPYLLFNREPINSVQIEPADLPPSEVLVESFLRYGQGLDLIGILAIGAINRGFASSLGQRNWSSKTSFNFDWSIYVSSDKAVKCSLAGLAWDESKLQMKMEGARQEAAIVSLPAKTIAPGKYRVFIAPAALEGFLDIISWNGFSLRSLRTKNSSLQLLNQQAATLSPLVTLTENFKDGVEPKFQEEGFIKPDQVELIKAGKMVGALISPRSAQEYQAVQNGAARWEGPSSLDLQPGQIAASDVVRELDTGVVMSNSWYLHFSELKACRLTGMTRFACFWVERGRIVAPLNVMRFDETIYNLLGQNLVGLTKEREFAISSSTYGSRSTASCRLPGALVRDFSFTL